jgi:hypothetical protein
MEKGSFELPELAGSSGRIAVILTQSWCPQWKAMKNYLPEAEKRLPGLETIYIEYDLAPFFKEFMAFKETTFDNREIPYVLYYRNGICTGWSNYVSLEGFLHRLS